MKEMLAKIQERITMNNLNVRNKNKTKILFRVEKDALYTGLNENLKNDCKDTGYHNHNSFLCVW